MQLKEISISFIYQVIVGNVSISLQKLKAGTRNQYKINSSNPFGTN